MAEFRLRSGALLLMFPAPNPHFAARTRDCFARLGKGESFVAEGRVIKPGRTLCSVHGEVYAQSGEKRTRCAVMQQALIVLHGQPDDIMRRN